MFYSYRAVKWLSYSVVYWSVNVFILFLKSSRPIKYRVQKWRLFLFVFYIILLNTLFNNCSFNFKQCYLTFIWLEFHFKYLLFFIWIPICYTIWSIRIYCLVLLYLISIRIIGLSSLQWRFKSLSWCCCRSMAIKCCWRTIIFTFIVVKTPI